MFLNSSLWHVVVPKMWRYHRRKTKNHKFRYPNPAANALELNDSFNSKNVFHCWTFKSKDYISLYFVQTFNCLFWERIFLTSKFLAIKFLTDIYIIQGELLHHILQRKHQVRIGDRQWYNYFLRPFINWTLASLNIGGILAIGKKLVS